MNSEEEKIKKFISEYREFLIANSIDIAKSIIGNTWFVYRYEKKYGYYEYFIRFSTVSELVDIILDEMRFELYCAVEKEIAPPENIDYELADQINVYYRDKKQITELSALIDIIQQSGLCEKSHFFELLNKLCEKKEDYEL